MKRIAENVALQTLFYKMNYLDNVRVEDYESPDCTGKCKVVYEGRLIDTTLYTFSGIHEYASVLGIRAENGTVVFQICTAFDTYPDGWRVARR